MALVKDLTNPIAQPAIDKARLMEVNVDPEKKKMIVKLAKGYDDNGEFVLKMASVHHIMGDDYDAMMDTMGDPAKSFREALEEAIWLKLEADGAIEVD